MSKMNTIIKALVCLMVSAVVAGCNKDDDNNNNEKPDWGPTITDNMLAISTSSRHWE